MSRYYGNIGFVTEQVETSPGIWEEVIDDRPYKGDVLSHSRSYEFSESINDNLALSNRFSVISDAYLLSHMPAMRYLEYMGTKFKIRSVEIDRPRVIISVGGVYVSGNEAD